MEDLGGQPEANWQVVFDGSCRFCRESCRILADKVAGLPVVFVDGSALGLDPKAFTELRLRTPEGQELAGFAAVVRLLALRWRRPWLAMLFLRTPFLQIGDWGYRWVARHRHRLWPA